MPLDMPQYEARFLIWKAYEGCTKVQKLLVELGHVQNEVLILLMSV